MNGECGHAARLRRRRVGTFTTTGPIPRVVALACKGYAFEQLEKSGQLARSPSLLPN